MNIIKYLNLDKQIILIGIFLFSIIPLLTAQSELKPYGALPSDRQLKWHETEMYCIMHYGLATYADKEWGYGDEDPKTFTAAKFDASKVVNIIKAAQFKGLVVVAKHHDGFCLWPTATTDYNITQSPWKNGKGDMIKEYQQACLDGKIKFGLYCSPWDRNHPLYGKPEYVQQVYIPQLKELYANYGDLFMSWHDGANGGDGYYGGARENRQIDRTTYYGWDDVWKITRNMQPNACIFGDAGPDVRWVGNEEGHAGVTCWATYTPQAREEGKNPANGFTKYEEGIEGTRDGKYWMPAECDVPFRPGWFYHKSQDNQMKSPHQLLDLYYKSVGRGACLDLGICLDQNGVLHENDERILRTFGSLLDQIFSNNLAKDAVFKPSNVRDGDSEKFGTSFLVDDDRYTYWATDDNITRPSLVIELPVIKIFNVIRLKENIKLGQRIEEIAIDAYLNGEWKEIATATSIGANRLIRLEHEVTSKQVRLRILDSPVCIALSEFGLFREPTQMKAPSISRSLTGIVTIQNQNKQKGFIYYTTDGSSPTKASSKYTNPFVFSESGIIRAITILNEIEFSETASVEFDFSKKYWSVSQTIPTSSKKEAMKAIDENNSTVSNLSTSLPQELIIDMGKKQIISGFTYLPRQDKIMDGIVDKYELHISIDGSRWEKVSEGEFSNIRSNPVKQKILFKKAVETRYFKFVAKHIIEGNSMKIAELGCF